MNQFDDLELIIPLLLPLVGEVDIDDLLYVVEHLCGADARDDFELELLFFLEKKAMEDRFAAPRSKHELS